MIGIGLGISFSSSPEVIPIPLDNVLAWHRKGRGVTLNGSDLSYWQDYMGVHHLEQSTASKQPAYSNGRVTFNGSSEYLSMVSGGLGIFNGKTGAAFYARCASRIDQATKFVMFASTGTSTSNYRAAHYTSTVQKMTHAYRRLDADSGQSQTYSSGTYTLNTAMVSGGQVDFTGNTRNVYLNGTSKGSGAAGSTGTISATNSLAIYVGSSGTANYFDGWIEEMIWAEGPANAAAFMAYLATL